MEQSDCQVLLAQIRVVEDFLRRPVEDHLAHIQNDRAVIARLERELAGSIGAASAHAVVTRITGTQMVGMTELIDIASETQQLIETSRQLAEKSAELERTAQQLRDVNDRLRALDAQKDDFLSQVSHALRTPMTSIRSFSEILMDEDGTNPAERARFVSIIHEESRRLTRLLDEILNLSRLESGAANLPLEPVALNDALDAALNSITGMTRARNVEVHVEHAPEDIRVFANDDRLRQALINILSNAVRYNTAPAPRIDLRARTDGQRAWIDVIDNGGGISREEADTVFDKFSRGSRATADQGAGLGLAISRAIMHAMQGDLTVEFAPDGTSFFRLELLCAQEAVAAK